MYYAIGVSVPSLHRESTDSLIIRNVLTGKWGRQYNVSIAHFVGTKKVS